MALGGRGKEGRGVQSCAKSNAERGSTGAFCTRKLRSVAGKPLIWEPRARAISYAHALHTLTSHRGRFRSIL
eukprot:748706-Rhodomonas_salina.1